MVHEVGSADTEIEDVDFLQDGVVEGIEEPGSVGDLVVGENPEHVEVRIRREPQTLLMTRNHTRNKRTMAKT